MKITNWAKTRTYFPENIYYPKNERDICQAIKRTYESGRKLKVIGSGLSFSNAPAIEQDVMILKDMNKVLSISPEEKKITVQGGANIRTINIELSKQQLAFKNFGSIVMQTAAGYTGTATHGSGIHTQILSADISEIKLVDGTGNLHVVNRSQNPELFAHARVHLGVLGVITEITFECTRAFDIEEELKIIDFDTALASLDDYLKNNEYCKIWWLPHTNKIQLYTYNTTTLPRTRKSLKSWLETTGISTVGFTSFIYLSRVFPKITPIMNQTIQKTYFLPHINRNQSDALFNISKMIPIHDEMEYAVPIEKATKAIEDIRSMIIHNRHYINFPMEIRFVASDDIPLSPSYNRNICYIGAYSSMPQKNVSYFKDFEDILKSYQARPHWGKNFYLSNLDFQRLYPKFQEFNNLRNTLDPNYIFFNKFSQQVFGT